MESKKTILVIEDREKDALLMRRVLEAAGFLTTWVLTSRETDLLTAMKEQPAAVVADFHLPPGNCLGVLEFLQAQGLDLPFIIVSGASLAEGGVEAVQAGKAEFINKARIRELPAVLNRALQLKQLSREKRQAEVALQASERRFRALIENANEAIALFDIQGTVLYTSPAIVRVLGYTAEEFMGQNAFAFIHPEDLARAQSKLSLVLREPAQLQVSLYRARHKNGQWRWVESHTTNLLDNPAVGALVSNFFDCTERHLATEQKEELTRQLLQQKALLDEILATVPGVVFEVSLEPGTYRWHTVFVSQYVETLFGYSLQEWMTQPDFWRQVVLPEDQENVWKHFLNNLATQKSWRLECRVKAKTGELVWVQLSMLLLRNAAGEPCGVRALTMDIGEQKRVEEQLVLQKGMLEALFEASIDGQLVVSPSGQWLFHNQRFLDLWQIPQDMALLRQDSGDLHHAQGLLADPDTFSQRLQSLYENPLLSGTEEIHLKNGLILDRYTTSVKNASGAHLGRLFQFRDFTQRTRDEAALRQSERRFRTLLENSSDGIALFDDTGVIIYASPSNKRLLGYEPEELLGDNVNNLLHPDSQAHVQERLRECLATPDSITLAQAFVRHKNGSWRCMEGVLHNCLHDPTIHGIVNNYRDITERREAEQRIRDQASLLDLAQDAIYRLDLLGKILYWNQGAQKLYGWSTQEAFQEEILSHLQPDSDQRQAMRSALLVRGEWSGEARRCSKSRVALIVNSRCTLLRDEQGQPKSFLVIDTDCTEKKGLEAQFLRAQRMECIGTMASGIAHDLNNIFAPILMSTPLLRMGLPPDEMDRVYTSVELSAQRGADIVRQLLSFGRGMSGERIPVMLVPLVTNLIKIFQETFPKDISITCKYPPFTWPVQGDDTQLNQVLLNLCLNARDAMPMGGRLQVELENLLLTEPLISAFFHSSSVCLQGEARPGNFLVIRVSDTGSGISAPVLEKIFDPFFTTKEVGQGTGLGLFTVLGIVKNHGGFITVTSHPGHGSTFSVYLPGLLKTALEELPLQPVEDFQGHGECLLLVDDEISVCETTRRVLENHGYKVIYCSDGAEAIALFVDNRARIRVVVSDLMMPNMDGMTLIRILRRMDAQIPIIVSTGLSQEGRMSELRVLGVQTVLHKPYPPHRLMQVLNECLQG